MRWYDISKFQIRVLQETNVFQAKLHNINQLVTFMTSQEKKMDNHSHPDKTNYNDQSNISENSEYLTPTCPFALRLSLSLSRDIVYTHVCLCVCVRQERAKGEREGCGARDDYGLSLRAWADKGRRRGQREERRITGTSGPRGYESSWANIELRDTVSPHESYTPRPKRSMGPGSTKYTLAITILDPQP